MDITDYDKIKLEFEEFSTVLEKNVIEKFNVDKVEQLIEAKYEPEDLYDIYIVINRILAEEAWQKNINKTSNELYYKTLTECINSNSIYNVYLYKGEKITKYAPVWSYTEFNNEYQKIGITDEKIIIRIKEI